MIKKAMREACRNAAKRVSRGMNSYLDRYHMSYFEERILTFFLVGSEVLSLEIRYGDTVLGYFKNSLKGVFSVEGLREMRKVYILIVVTWDNGCKLPDDIGDGNESEMEVEVLNFTKKYGAALFDTDDSIEEGYEEDDDDAEDEDEEL